MYQDFDRCYRAIGARDSRFDGWFVVAVHTTGIYCRPSCPARTPLPGNVAFHPSAAAAQRAGFRACKRCRPDASPGSPEWNVRGDLVARAMRLIDDGTVDRDGVPGLAARLGYTTRQIERVLQSELGAGPLALARAQRAQTARLLIESSALPLGDIAFAAGFSSVRQFNDTVRSVFGCPPSGLRRLTRTPAAVPGALTLRLPVRQPFDHHSLFAHLAATSVPGCEEVRDGSFRRTLRLPHGNGVVTLTPFPDQVRCTLRLDDFRDVTVATARCRRLLDLDADPLPVHDALAADPALDALVRAVPGRRIPRTVDEHELAIRVVLAQQVSTRAAGTHAARLVRDHGRPIIDPDGGLTHTFPSAGDLLGLDPQRLALPTARRSCLIGLIGALVDGSVVLDPGCDRAAARAQLSRLPGIGPWSTELIAMRGLGDPDAFPGGDLGVRRGAGRLGLPDDAAGLTARAERWRPWRSYATQYLWAALGADHPMNTWPPPKEAP